MSNCESAEGAREPETSGEQSNHHPRILQLREGVAVLPVDQEYRIRLYHSIDRYADRLVARPNCVPGEGSADLDVVQALAQADLNERNLMAWIELCRRRALGEL